MQSLTKAQRQLIQNVATENGFREYEMEYQLGSLKGDNYLGIIFSITIKNTDRQLDLILKAAKQMEAVPVHSVFVREITLYDNVFKEFDKLQNKLKPIYPFKGYAKFYGASEETGHEFLVMDNLKKKGFQMWNRKIPMNSAHLINVLKEYAKLHSLSFALKKENPEKMENYAKSLTDVFMTEFSQDRFDSFFKSIITKMRSVVEDNKIALEAVEKFAPNVVEYYTKELADPSNQLVITHGDCWCNNMLFYYKNPDDTSEPEQVCFIDWQISKYGSPASDLVYFLFASSDKQNLYNYKKYLRCYYDVFSENLKSMGCDPEELYPYSMLEKHFKLHAKFGLNLAIMILRVIMCEMDEAPDLTNIKKDSDFSDVLNFESIHEEAYKQRVLDLVLFMVDNDLF